jgi:hypothetical protein
MAVAAKLTATVNPAAAGRTTEASRGCTQEQRGSAHRFRLERLPSAAFKAGIHPYYEGNGVGSTSPAGMIM